MSYFSPTEKVAFTLFAAVFAISSMVIVWKLDQKTMVTVPAYGDTITEGVIGTPRFINPVLALSDVDRDLTSIVYSGLMKVGRGELVPDLAEKYDVSPDGLTYTFTLRNNIFFHSGAAITSDDVEFTIQKAQDPLIKSPRRASWDGITIHKLGPKQISFILKKPYAPFLENTTLGILPKNIWKNVTADQFTFSNYNIAPIGSGPFMLKNIVRDSGGLPQSYELSAYSKYAGGKPYLAGITFNFYPNEQAVLTAFNNGSIQSLESISPIEAVRIASSTDAQIARTPLPRIFGAFFNQTQAPVLANKEVRTALNIAVDRDMIVRTVLMGYGTKTYSAIPTGILPISPSTPGSDTELMRMNDRVTTAKALLEKNGWTLGSDGVYIKKGKKDIQTLEFSLATSDAPELRQTAELLKRQWQAIGARVTVKIFETGDLNQNIIRPRKYDALLFGEIIGRDLDLFAFWHSSQRSDPGLNIAQYVNTSVDKLIETARTTSDSDKRQDMYSQIQDTINTDIPAVFIYSPDFIYVLPHNLQNAHIEHITSPEDRWNGVEQWYINTDSVWKIFTRFTQLLK